MLLKAISSKDSSKETCRKFENNLNLYFDVFLFIFFFNRNRSPYH